MNDLNILTSQPIRALEATAQMPSTVDTKVEMVGTCYKKVFLSPELRTEFAKFLNNIFMQLDEKKFFALIDDIMTYAHTDEEIYQELANRIGEAKGGFLTTAWRILRSLKIEKKEISALVGQVLGNDKTVNGYAEIGFPGRYIRPFKAELNLKGPFYAVNYNQQASDYIQTGFPRPYHQFVPLNDYEPIKQEKIGNSSVDLATCFIGLHHVPEDKLKDFIQSIHRILRPGGSFILRDHDVSNDDLQSLVNVVHSVFNAATGVSPEEEKKEIRQFKSLNAWIVCMQENGFELVSDPKMRKGDPTLNTLLRFEKLPTQEEEMKQSLAELPGYERAGLQTYMTTLEWHIVDVSKQYADFITHTPFYKFPYFKHVGLFWKLFKDSWKSARVHYNFMEVATSEYALMNAFMGVVMTVEFIAKGILSAPMAWWYGSEQHKEADRIQILVEDPQDKIDSLDERIQVIKNFQKKKFKVISVPRYVPFREILLKLSQADIRSREIAGQQKIQLKVQVANGTELPELKGCKKLYEWPIITDSTQRFMALEVNVKKLGSVIRSLETKGIAISYIHDF